jgi:hypothetical protein
VINPQAVAQKWQQNLARSGDAVKAGVQQVTVAPGQKAAANAQKMADAVQASVTSGLYARRVSAIPLGEWQQSMINVGIPRLQTGAQKGLPKMIQYLQVAAPVYDEIKNTCANMPNNSDEDAIAKVRYAMQKMRQLKQSR